VLHETDDGPVRGERAGDAEDRLDLFRAQPGGRLV
jgi:hypothetical protein